MKKILIVGAGVAGMTAGIYGQLNGFDTEIYEMHTVPGGECTGWTRGDYHFDGCIHWMSGTRPGTKMNRLWREVGALDDTVGIVNHEYFFRMEENNQVAYVYTDIDRFEKHLLEMSPQDAPLIRKTCKDVRTLRCMKMPVDKPMDMMNLIDGIKAIFTMGSAMPLMKEYGSITVEEFAAKFQHPLLQAVFASIAPMPYSVSAMLVTLASLSTGDSGWPLGGSLAVARRMEKRYLSLGGKIFYKAKVDKILVKDGKATGVRLTDGKEIYGDYVISAADGHATLFDMLEGKYLDEKLKALYTDRETYLTYTTLKVSIGLACDFSSQPHTLYFKPPKKVDAGGMSNERLLVRHYCYDPSLAPAGKSSINVMLGTEFDWWQEKYKDPEAYRREKELIAAEVCRAVEEKYPEVKGKIEKVDVATPMTYVRYCNTWRGAWMAWMMTPKANIGYMPGNLPGLGNFYMAGQWTMPPGGLPGAVLPGRWVIYRICKGKGMKFHTSV